MISSWPIATTATRDSCIKTSSLERVRASRPDSRNNLSRCGRLVATGDKRVHARRLVAALCGGSSQRVVDSFCFSEREDERRDAHQRPVEPRQPRRV